mmetsp:Transcript_31969/g.65102  ORF Transcript_31969/g.65102 Transcript_31969/m.65102 type:complete len:292 (+) Transcript_31969:1-876(+)
MEQGDADKLSILRGQVTVPAKRIKELYDHAKKKSNAFGESMNVTMKNIKGIKIKTQVQSAFTLVWDSRTIGARSNFSAWSPFVKKVLGQRNRDRLVLGHYAVSGLKDPSKDKALKNTVVALEITDTAVTRFGSVGASSPYLDGAIERLCPHPVRFRQVWNTLGKRTDSHLFVWQAVTPDDTQYVALGMCCTSEDDPPPLTAMRCVPLRWCNRGQPCSPKLLWDDAGTGGKRGAVWIVNSFGLMAVGRGTEPPKEHYYDLAADRFFLSAEDLAVLNGETPLGAESAHGGGEE